MGLLEGEVALKKSRGELRRVTNCDVENGH
jgi:hypothetical protein